MLKKTVKKVPIKGEVVKPLVETICSDCGKTRPYSNKTKKLCAVCVKKSQIAKVKEKRAKIREKRTNTITQVKLDQITSWLIRAAFEEKCYACEVRMPRKQLQCCHFVSRTKSMTRVDLRNMLPGCPTCNMYTPHHVWNLGKSINKIWGEDMTEVLLGISSTSLKMNNNDRREIYDLYKAGLEKLEFQSLSSDEKLEVLVGCFFRYHGIISRLLVKR
jgi:hypothetical protein